jgi:transposase InsO family protein
VWVADITYLRTREGRLYLAVVLDLGTRAVVGWAMRHTLERGLALDALEMAVRRRRPGPGVLHHADRGSQYACRDYRAALAAYGMLAQRRPMRRCAFSAARTASTTCGPFRGSAP